MPGDNCCGHAPSENQAYVVGVNRVGADGHGVAHAGDSAAISISGPHLAQGGRCSRNSQRRARACATRSVPGGIPRAPGCRPVYAGALERSARDHEKATLVNHPPTVELPPGNRPLVAPIYQTVNSSSIRSRTPSATCVASARASSTRALQPHHAPAGGSCWRQLQGREECLVTPPASRRYPDPAHPHQAG